jgi:hypothetical protein
MAYPCNPSYLAGWDLENLSSRPEWANSSWDPPPHFQNNQSKEDRRYVPQAVKRLLCKHKALVQTPKQQEQIGVEYMFVSTRMPGLILRQLAGPGWQHLPRPWTQFCPSCLSRPGHLLQDQFSDTQHLSSVRERAWTLEPDRWGSNLCVNPSGTRWSINKQKQVPVWPLVTYFNFLISKMGMLLST